MITNLKHIPQPKVLLTCQRCGDAFETSNPLVNKCPECASHIGGGGKHIYEPQQSPPRVDISNRPIDDLDSISVNGQPEVERGLGTNGYLSHPTHEDLFLMAFRLLRPIHRIYLEDFHKKQPVLHHGDSGYPHRSAYCHERVVPGLYGAEIRRSKEDPRRVAIGGTVRCKSVHLCPVCGLAASLNWQKDIIACEEALREDGYRLVLVVLTLYHERGDSLERTMDIIRRAYTKAFAIRNKQQKKYADRYKIVGRLRAWDILWGSGHGWHPHLNVMLAVKADWQLEDFVSHYQVIYLREVLRLGGFANCEHGFKVTEYKNGKSYTLKTGYEGVVIKQTGKSWTLGHEMVSPGKSQSGMTIAALRGIATGTMADDCLSASEAKQLIMEYAKTMSGERMVICAGVVREIMREVRRGKCDCQNDTRMLTEDSEIEAIIPAPDYGKKIVRPGNLAALVEAAREGRVKLFGWLADLDIMPNPRDLAIQDACKDSLNWGKKNRRDRAGESLERQILADLGSAALGSRDDLDDLIGLTM